MLSVGCSRVAFKEAEVCKRRVSDDDFMQTMYKIQGRRDHANPVTELLFTDMPLALAKTQLCNSSEQEQNAQTI